MLLYIKFTKEKGLYCFNAFTYKIPQNTKMIDFKIYIFKHNMKI